MPRYLFSGPAPALGRQYSRHFAVVEELCQPDAESRYFEKIRGYIRYYKTSGG